MRKRGEFRKPHLGGTLRRRSGTFRHGGHGRQLKEWVKWRHDREKVRNGNTNSRVLYPLLCNC